MSTQEQVQIRPGADWQPAGEYEDIRYEIAEGITKITINRPELRNAFRPQTLIEMSDALNRAREDLDVGVIVLAAPAGRRARPLLARRAGRRPRAAARTAGAPAPQHVSPSTVHVVLFGNA